MTEEVLQVLSERPKCQFKGCQNPAFVWGYQRWLCGTCFVKIKEILDKETNDRINSLEI